MEAFQRHPTILQGAEAKKIIKNYNKLAKVLLEFEMLYHRGWIRQVPMSHTATSRKYSIALEFAVFFIVSIFPHQVEIARSGLNASLCVKRPDTGELFVNFDPQLLVLIRETECMARLGLEIPPQAKALRAKQGYFKDKYNALNVSTWHNMYCGMMTGGSSDGTFTCLLLI